MVAGNVNTAEGMAAALKACAMDLKAWRPVPWT